VAGGSLGAGVLDHRHRLTIGTEYLFWMATEGPSWSTGPAPPGRVSQIERGELPTIDAIARYVQALGGRLDLVASFTDHTLTVTTTDAA